MNKKFLLLIAILVLVAGLVACNDKEKENASGEKVTPQTSDTSAVDTSTGEQETDANEIMNIDPYVANIPNEILDFYLEKVEAINTAYEESLDKDNSSMPELKYDLVFFNDDNIPELVVNKEGYSVALYTYDAGKVIYAMKDEDTGDDESGWPYGAGGNHGYEYLPRMNTLRNLNADHAGLIMYYYLAQLNPDTHLLESKYAKELYVNHFDDKNDNGKLDEDEMEGYVEDGKCFYDGEEVPAEEFSSYVMADEEFVPLTGTKSYEEIKEALTGLINEK